jgi:enediyne biosynthesis protein E4
MDTRIFFGMGKNTMADSLVVEWPGGARTVLKNVQADQFLQISPTPRPARTAQSPSPAPLFKPAERQNFQHLENNFVDFKTQILLPHGHSRQSPALAVGDANGDGFDDFFVSGALGGESVLFFQKADGSFSKKTLETACPADESAAHFFDADGDGDLDLYVVRGGSEYREGTDALQDALFLNDGRGNFEENPQALPITKSAGGCVVSSDIDRDGDTDLFVGGRVAGGEYPRAPRSFLLQNDGKGRFVDATPDFLKNIGMVADAVFADFDGDGRQDLALAGEFMPVTVVMNEDLRMEKMTNTHPAPIIVQHSAGWWNALKVADFDRDGDLDLLAGNLGLNSRYRATQEAPLSIFSKDFDNNGTADPIICHVDAAGQRQIFHTRDELTVQIPAMKKRFSSYRIFAETPFDKSFRKEELEGVMALEAQTFESGYFENQGGGKFVFRALPLPAQVAPIQDFLVDDFNGDGNLDFLAVGNSYEADYTTGRYDAGAGCLFLGDGHGSFAFMENRRTGFWADGDARSVVLILMKNGQKQIIIGNNGAGLQVYSWNTGWQTK